MQILQEENKKSFMRSDFPGGKYGGCSLAFIPLHLYRKDRSGHLFIKTAIQASHTK